MSQHISTANEQKLGLELARALHHAIRTVRTHDLGNDVAVEAVGALSDSINTIVARSGGFALHVLGDYVYVGDQRLREDGMSTRFLESLVHELDNRGIGSVHGDARVSREDVQKLVSVLSQFPAGGDEAFREIRSRLATYESGIGVGPTRDVPSILPENAAHVTKKEECKRTFFRAVSVTESLMRSAHLGKRLQLRHAKRMVQQIVDLMLDEEFTFLGLTTLKSHDNYTYHHSVNVSIYAIALGKRAGLTNLQLSELGTGALLHDLGKIKVPTDLIQKDGMLSDDETLVMRRHPMLGAKEIVQLGGFSPLALKAMVGCFEHHMHFDGSRGGYPELDAPYRPHVFGRLISVVDCFDALTTKRVYRNQAMRRDRALSYMMSESGTKFDPLLMRLFTNMIGIYPVGTTVRLASGRMAVVTQASDDPRFAHRPVVRPITDTSGIEVSGAAYEVVDLSLADASGAFPDEIVASLDAEAMGLDVSRYFA
ncbi:MAG: HD domain-containing protein [Candidatus Eisenbacteria bacterium]|nr:HD domain-containing protein [Candidatus Eisenbacteria bacterium]